MSEADSLTVNGLQDRVHAWADETFPNRTPAIAWMKMFEELGEVIKNPEDPLEWADVFILLMDLASMHEINIPQACIDKMLINSGRIWQVGPTGVMQHVEEGGLRYINPNTEPKMVAHDQSSLRFFGGHKDGVIIERAMMVPEDHATWWPFGTNGGCYFLSHQDENPANARFNPGYITYNYKWSDDGIPF